MLTPTTHYVDAAATNSTDEMWSPLPAQFLSSHTVAAGAMRAVTLAALVAVFAALAVTKPTHSAKPEHNNGHPQRHPRRPQPDFRVQPASSTFFQPMSDALVPLNAHYV
ncbi:hypothetical protein MIND_01235100 [Mycena indigotica]|uniref:Uncharacterized protein n=1 Tax=Mycena indigotica TaxID=2126181 RepID=A0A8H6S449_9AGAR|nr:uncharacterized protein MIND_01235100 [Mycena indigotica]KAF7292087.1 hypothetical protein MIND_01235100 [Mycena indigotica]